MNIVYNGIEILASSVEVFVLYKIYSILLYKQRGKQNFILDRELAIIGTVLIQICNHVSIFSYFTIILFVLYDVGVKTINKFNPIPYSTLKKFIFCSISPRFGEYMTGIPYLVLCKYRIWGIVSQTLHIIEEFPEIQRCYLGTEKELATLFPTRNLFQMVILTDI